MSGLSLLTMFLEAKNFPIMATAAHKLKRETCLNFEETFWP
jgi:hypothetical protein